MATVYLLAKECVSNDNFNLAILRRSMTLLLNMATVSQLTKDHVTEDLILCYFQVQPHDEV